MERHSSYLKMRDGEKIFFTTNFKHNSPPKNKPLIIFNYGLVCSNAHFQDQLPFFDQHGYPILTHDLRGHHNSSGAENIEKCTFDNFTEDINEIILHLGIDKVFMIGHSMGVNTTLEFAKKFPDKIIGQVLISGTVVPPGEVMFDGNYFEFFTPIWKKVKNKYPQIHEWIWKTNGQNPLIQKLVHSGGFNTKSVPIEFVQIYLNRVANLPEEIFFQCFDEMGRHDIIAYLEKIQTPTLVMGGDKDKIVPNYLQKILVEKLPNAKLYLIKDGSHVPQVDFPKTVNDRILKFIQSL